MNVDVFASGKSLNPSVEFKWVAFPNVGDKYQGVFVGIVKNNDGYGNPQTTYLIEQPDKTVLGVGMKDAKTRFHELMASVKVGQHVGFVYTKDLDVGKPNKAKIIEIVTDPTAVDPNWAGKAGVETSIVENTNGEIGTIPENIFGPVVTSTPATPTVSVSEKVKQISELAKTKLGAQNAEEVKVQVKAKTGLDFTPETLDNIILQLELL